MALAIVDARAKNRAMRKLVEKHGFKLEGKRTKRVKRDGRYHDEACYVLIL